MKFSAKLLDQFNRAKENLKQTMSRQLDGLFRSFVAKLESDEVDIEVTEQMIADTECSNNTESAPPTSFQTVPRLGILKDSKKRRLHDQQVEQQSTEADDHAKKLPLVKNGITDKVNFSCSHPNLLKTEHSVSSLLDYSSDESEDYLIIDECYRSPMSPKPNDENRVEEAHNETEIQSVVDAPKEETSIISSDLDHNNSEVMLNGLPSPQSGQLKTSLVDVDSPEYPSKRTKIELSVTTNDDHQAQSIESKNGLRSI